MDTITVEALAAVGAGFEAWRPGVATVTLVLAAWVCLRIRRGAPGPLNWSGAILWYVGAINPTGKARALHPVAWIVFAVAMIAHATRGAWRAARETKGEWVAW